MCGGRGRNVVAAESRIRLTRRRRKSAADSHWALTGTWSRRGFRESWAGDNRWLVVSLRNRVFSVRRSLYYYYYSFIFRIFYTYLFVVIIIIMTDAVQNNRLVLASHKQIGNNCVNTSPLHRETRANDLIEPRFSES